MTIACADCGALEDLPPLAAGDRAVCPVCANNLELTSGRSIDAALGCALGTFFFLFPANLVPLMSVSMLSMRRSSLLSSGVIDLWNEQWALLAILIGAFAIVLPFIRFGLLSLALGTIRLGYRPWWLGSAFRWAVWLDTWAMPDVFLLGAFVGYSRVAANLNVTIEWGGYCFIAAAFLSMVSRASLDRQIVWRAIGPDRHIASDAPMLSCLTCDLVAPAATEGRPCPRCRAPLRTRKPDSILRTGALTAAAFILFWPANIYPMSTSVQLGEPVPYRIIDGVRALFAAGFAPLGVIIFFTSIAIPALKILGLGWCVISTLRRSRKHLVLKTRLYRAIDELGRWSNVDPFTIAVFVPLMKFDSLASSHAAPGSTPFILVVALTLAASQFFDPRLMWDAIEDAGG
jgi:paraquat-inducible protein A